MLFSFVVPIYNAENYLSECLSSIENQTYRDFEVWMIDDGSIDGSSLIATSFAEKDKRFHYIRQDNQGTSGATNTGLSLVNGDYVINLDNDDYIDPNLLMISTQVIKAHSPDIIQFQAVFVDAHGKENHRQCFLREPIAYTGNSQLFHCEEKMPGAFNRTHSRKVFRRAVIDGMRFQGTSKGADTSFLRRVLFRSEKVVLRPEHMFFVRELQTSESRKPNQPYLYKEWFSRCLDDIDYCIAQNQLLHRQRPFFEFSDTLDLLQIFAAKAIRDRAYDNGFFRWLSRELIRRNEFLVPRNIRYIVRWNIWLVFTKTLARRLARKLPKGDFIV